MNRSTALPVFRALAAIVALFALLASCAVTSGSTFGSVTAAVEAGSDESDSPEDDPPPSDGETPRLRVTTEPRNADVFLDGRRRGSTPLDLDEIEPGAYLLRIEKDGYYTVRRWIEIPESGSLRIEMTLEQITGFLDVEARPRGATVRVDGSRLSGGFAELPVGRYQVRAELFGYRAARRSVTVSENRVTRVRLDLEKAPFEIADLSVRRRAFNPSNPGLLGTAVVSYRVTAPGDGELVIRDPSGTVVHRAEQGPYRSWEQDYRWDGSYEDGQTVPDGTYEIEINATGDDGRYEQAVTTVTVDSSIVVRYRSVWGAAPGLLYAPTRGSLPAGQSQIAVQAAGIISVVDNRIVSRFPGRIGARVGLGAELELSGYGGFTAHSEPLDDRYSAGGSITWDGVSGQVGALRLGLGVAAGGAYRSASPDGAIAGPDTQASYPGFFVSLPISLGTRAVSLVVAPEYRLTVAPVFYGDDPPENSWGSIAYLRSGVVADLGRLTLGLSGALRTKRFDEGFVVDLPFQTGAELHWILPESAVGLSGFVAAEVESAKDFYVMSGLGIGVLF